MGIKTPTYYRNTQQIPDPVIQVSSGSAITLNPNQANIYVVTVDASTTIDLSPPSTETSAITVKLIQSGNSHTVTWGTSIGWEGGIAPTLQTTDGGIDIITFLYYPDVPGWFGFASALDCSNPTATFPTLGFEIWATPASDTAASTTNYSLATNYQLGNQRLGVVWAITTNALGSDPPTPTITGGGASSWALEETRTFNTGGVVGRRMSMFVARDETTGSASNFVVSWTGGETQTGCVLLGLRTTGAVPSSALTLASTKGVQNGGSGTDPSTTFGAASDAANRQVWAIACNVDANTNTPEANWDALFDRNMTSPSIKLFVLSKDDSFDTTATSTFGTSAIWAAMGTEIEQG